MMNFLWNRFSKRRNDRADSTVVTFVLVFPLFFSFLVTMIDTSMYFSNRSLIQQNARDAARTIAIFGGSGTGDSATTLEYAYGDPNQCDLVTAEQKTIAGGESATSVECHLAERLQTAGLTAVEIKSVDCGPSRTTTVGAPTFCEVQWDYKGIPGSVMNFIRGDGESEDSLGQNTTRVTSESEVGLTAECVRRDSGAVNPGVC